jgi:lipopolysaccharide transport system ATP-binding protein
MNAAAGSPLATTAASDAVVRTDVASVPGDARMYLSLSHVGKDYAKIASRAGRVRLVWDLLRGHGAASVFRALDDVTFDLRPGASLGISGDNGAGKSTLLKIIAGVIKPTRGSVVVNGRVGALLELGSGFHPEYSGLANIDLAAALLGLSPPEVGKKRDAIIEFADLGEHIDEPIKHYSSGMVVRLGFAVATALDPDVLITDEVLAVGDESFQKKCIAWIETFLAGGGTLLLCSHSMYHVQKLCRDALWLKDGVVVRYGDAPSVTQAYLAWHEEKSAETKTPIPQPVASAAGVYAVQSLTLDPGDDVMQGATLVVRGDVYSPDGRAPVVLVGIVRADGTPVYGVSTDMDRIAPTKVDTHTYRFVLEFPRLELLPGKYTLRAHALDPEGVRLFDHVESSLVVRGDAREFGMVRLPHAWRS